MTVVRIVRILFGLLLLVFFGLGLGIFGWMPPTASGAGRPMQDAIAGSGYIIPIIEATYLVVGVSYLTNRYVALASVILFPVSLNILLFHLILDPGTSSLIAALLLFILNLSMLYVSRQAYGPLLKSQT
jgi:putative oxidoreductase